MASSLLTLTLFHRGMIIHGATYFEDAGQRSPVRDVAIVQRHRTLSVRPGTPCRRTNGTEKPWTNYGRNRFAKPNLSRCRIFRHIDSCATTDVDGMLCSVSRSIDYATPGVSDKSAAPQCSRRLLCRLSSFGVVSTVKHVRLRLQNAQTYLAMARCCNGKAFGLAIGRSRVQILLEATLRNNLGKLFTPMCLCHQAV